MIALFYYDSLQNITQLFLVYKFIIFCVFNNIAQTLRFNLCLVSRLFDFLQSINRVGKLRILLYY